MKILLIIGCMLEIIVNIMIMRLNPYPIVFMVGTAVNAFWIFISIKVLIEDYKL